MASGGININTIKLMLSVMTLAVLMAVCASAADDGAYDHEHNFGGDHHGFNGHDRGYDWLNPGGSHSYTWWTPYYYDYTWYPTYTYSYYPTQYYYTTPVAYSTYYYDPAVYNYDPWWAANVYGPGGATYYSSWSWSSHHGGFF
jgi:hypothetical protein